MEISFRIVTILKKMQLNRVETTVLQVKIRVVKRKTLLPVMSRLAGMDIKIVVFGVLVYFELYKGKKRDILFMWSKSYSDFRRDIWRKSMHYNVKAVPEKLVLKNVFVGLHEAKGDLLKKENEIKNRPLHFATWLQFVWWLYQRLGTANRKVLPSCVL